MSKAVSSVHVRQSFKNFFHQRKHVIGRSSSIVPWNDPSLAFVNAGMNQFKRVFLGEELAPHPRLVNCQKCIRVGGKHNDLDAVGRSRRHHSFFEMLGNWSFGDYGKKEACSMAWEFLTAELGIPASNLHVTVFQGSDHFPRDEEVERIWEDIGVPRERIFARDERENFWSMGLTGPCGPCTEIHLRQSDGKELELWNIVFMGWDKQLGDGIPTFSKLGSFCIDTGLGLERLVATLEGGDSNYDTDLFQPILRRLQELTGGPSYSGLFANSAATGDEQPSDLSKDEAYRLIADHARMVTVALSDGMFPDACQKLRHVIWRAFHRLEKQFDVDAGSTANILIELSKVVESILSPEYPEISRSRRIQEILVHEEMVYRRLNSRAQELRPHLPKRVAETLELDKIHECPGILEAIADVNRIIKAGELKTRVDGSQYVPPETLGRLHRSYNVSMEKLFAILDWKSLDYDPTGWHIEDAKQEAVPLADPFLSAALAFEKVASNDQSQSPTEDDWKYQATWTSDGKVRIEPLRCTVVFAQPIRDDQLEDGRVINAGDNGFIILDRTNFYAESGGQSGDVGTLTNDDVGVCFQVEDTQKRKGQVVHRGRLIRGTLEPGMKVIAMPDEEGRAACSANHTATHLLNSALHRVLAVTGQRGSSVTRNGFCFDFVSLEGALPPTKVIEIEDWVNRIIQDGYQIETKTIPFDDALSHSDLILLPGEPYPPRNSRMVIVSSASSNESDVPFSRELCGGTHVENTRDIQRFVITAHHGVKMGVRSIRGVTRAKAFECEKVGKVMVEQLEEILQECRSTKDLSKKEVEQLDKRVQGLKAKMYLKCYPFRLESDISTQAEEAERTLRSKKRVDVLETIQEDIASVLARPEVECLPYFVYGIAIPTNVFLSKVTRDCPPDKPVCVVGATVRGEIVARTSVPKDCVNSTFDAEKWLNSAASSAFAAEAKIGPPRGQDGTLVCNLKSLKPVASEEERRRICDEVKRAAIRVAESGMFGRDHASSVSTTD